MKHGIGLSREWRFALLAGVAVGLGLAPAAPVDPPRAVLGVVPATALLLAALRPRSSRIPAASWLGLIVLTAALGGFLAGGARLHAVDAGAVRAAPGTPARVDGFVAGVPHRSHGEVQVRLDTPAGRLLGVVPEPVGELHVGAEVSASGVLAPPAEWQRSYLERQGIAMVLRASRLEEGEGRRGGLSGWIDGIRSHAEEALGRGMPEREAALARGFVLGQDDRIDPRTRDDFQRSSLTHLLAVSGENVVLLCVLSWPLLALAGLRLRGRLVGALLLVAIYVPVTGAGPSIQRAGVMGAAGLIAALADRPRSRWYAVLLAAAVTLLLNPRSEADVGWQLSFAAVIGIMFWSRRLTGLIGGDTDRGSARRALAEGIAVTAAATIATAPLMASAFDQFSPASLPANVLALPAVAPAMWLGMLTGIAGQVPGLPVEPINWLNSLCLAHIAQVAHWLATPRWALLTVHLGSIWSVLAAYLALIGTMELLLRRPPSIPSPRRLSGRAAAVCLAALGLFAVAWVAVPSPSHERARNGLVVRVLDVGQGDSILLQPPNANPVLVDTGPPGDGVEDRLNELGIDRLAALVVTHDESDHAGDLDAILGSIQVDRVVYGANDARVRATAAGHGVTPLQLAQGGELASGALRLSAIWPPRERLNSVNGNPNLLALVLRARWKHFSMLLTADAEAEAVPLDSGPVDVLKVAHHGSADEGLDDLLAHAVPKLAVISVGADNTYGHPTQATLTALREHGVPTLRTDDRGEIEIDADGSGWTARGEGG